MEMLAAFLPVSLSPCLAQRERREHVNSLAGKPKSAPSCWPRASIVRGKIGMETSISAVRQDTGVVCKLFRLHLCVENCCGPERCPVHVLSEEPDHVTRELVSVEV